MPPVLIDTNLLVTLYDVHNPEKAARAQQVLDRLELARTGRLSVQNKDDKGHQGDKDQLIPWCPLRYSVL